ncbi:MAG: hypothetical protein OEW87_08410, partial [Flavobacteriaceae bacterium]|nr:hypothetical protein [Flavobacteriaceae bacterium]
MKLNSTNFFNKINVSLVAKRPFVAYNYPNSKEIKGFFQLDDTLHYRIDFEDSGFIFAPFDDKKKAILFPCISSEIYETNLSGVTFPKIS